MKKYQGIKTELLSVITRPANTKIYVIKVMIMLLMLCSNSSAATFIVMWGNRANDGTKVFNEYKLIDAVSHKSALAAARIHRNSEFIKAHQMHADYPTVFILRDRRGSYCLQPVWREESSKGINGRRDGFKKSKYFTYIATVRY
ncbi:MAG: hypothetical protein H7A51_14585 [Akkermansiaceae bacterium]|nr:hypothetical protein [Akkermansiaceae bacterium]